jgi:hypothetical protein
MVPRRRVGMSTEELCGREWMMDHRVVRGKVGSNVESMVKEKLRLDMMGLDSNKMYEVGTEEWSSREWMIDHRVVRGKVDRYVESMMRELRRFDMMGLDSSNKMCEMGTEEVIRFGMMGSVIGKHNNNKESGVRERAEFEMRELYSYTVYEVRRTMGFKEELWDRWYRASPKEHHL